eukprot:jgi/Botrbrau1/22087/Bobra.0206s0014.1
MLKPSKGWQRCSLKFRCARYFFSMYCRPNVFYKVHLSAQGAHTSAGHQRAGKAPLFSAKSAVTCACLFSIWPWGEEGRTEREAGTSFLNKRGAGERSTGKFLLCMAVQCIHLYK